MDRLRTLVGGGAEDPGDDLAARAAERARAGRRVLLHRAAIAAVGVILMAALGWLMAFSSVFALDSGEVVVTGAGPDSTVSVEAVHAIVDPAHGTPLLRLDVADLRARIEGIDTVVSAEVQRTWPTGLQVDVTARVPVAVAQSDDGLVLLDVDAVVVGRPSEAPDDLPLVTVSEGEPAVLAAVLAVLADLPEELRAEVVEAGARHTAGVELEMADGSTVRWGSATESELKVQVLEVLRTEPAATYDVSVPRAPIATG